MAPIALPYRLSVAILLFAGTCASQATERSYCGGALTDLLVILCNGIGFYNPPTKRFAGTHQRNNYINSRVRRSITSECCRNTCPISTLQSYCSAEPDLMHISRVFSVGGGPDSTILSETHRQNNIPREITRRPTFTFNRRKITNIPFFRVRTRKRASNRRYLFAKT